MCPRPTSAQSRCAVNHNHHAIPSGACKRQLCQSPPPPPLTQRDDNLWRLCGAMMEMQTSPCFRGAPPDDPTYARQEHLVEAGGLSDSEFRFLLAAFMTYPSDDSFDAVSAKLGGGTQS